MKRLLFIATIFISFNSFSQNADQPYDSVPAQFERQYFVYQVANKYNDAAVAKAALYQMLAMNPTNTALLDTLALMYYEFQQYTSAALVSQDAASINPDDALANEIAALSFDNLGLKDRAVKYYERMYLQTTDVGVLYRMAFLQFELKRFNEATASVDGLIDSEDTKNQKVYFPKEDKTQQEISLLAGAYRLKGMIEKELGNVENAKANFNKALEISPDFEIVKKQLAEF